MLGYQREIIAQAQRTAAGLWVVAPGLGLSSIIQQLVYCEERAEKRRGKNRVIIILNATPDQFDLFPPHRFPVINADIESQQRSAYYMHGGVLFVTSRVLVVDLLRGRLPWHLVRGFVVWDAHKVKESSTEAFILRLHAESVSAQASVSASAPTSSNSANTNTDTLTEANSFVWAFTDVPHGLVNYGTFNRVEKAMRTLTVTKLYLFPRFRGIVRTSLGDIRLSEDKSSNITEESQPPSHPSLLCTESRERSLRVDTHKIDLVKLGVSMTPEQKKIHDCIETIMRAVITEIASSTSAAAKESSPQLPEPLARMLTLENTMFRSFYTTIKEYMTEQMGDARFSPKVRSLIKDLEALRKLLERLVQSDAVSFYAHLEQMRRFVWCADGKQAPGWFLLPEADSLFTLAKARLYVIESVDAPAASTNATDSTNRNDQLPSAVGGSTTPPAQKRLKLVLETLPKWEMLADILHEVSNGVLLSDSVSDDSDRSGERLVVVVTKDEQAADSVEQYLLKGGASLMAHKLQQHAQLQKRVNELARLSEEDDMNIEDPDAQIPQSEVSSNTGDVPTTPTRSSSEPTLDNSKQSSPTSSSAVEKALTLLQQKLSIRSASVIDLTAEDAPQRTRSEPRDYRAEYEQYFGLLQLEEETAPPIPSDQSEEPTHKLNKRALPRVIILSAPNAASNGMSLLTLLEELSPSPSVVVLLEPEQRLLRECEVYKAHHPAHPVRVYISTYRNSVEEMKYSAADRKEKDNFAFLIKEKEKLSVPDAMEGKLHFTDVMGRNTRIGGISRSLPVSINGPRVIVDIREFRSKLPGMLHAHGIAVIPRTLLVGDYILTKSLIVERKSVSDLVQSFSSGRLYKQVENMTRAYSQAVLLIEFDQSQPFALSDAVAQTVASNIRVNDVDISVNSITSKIVLLTKTFPRLRILWSRSPAETAQLFFDLKSGHPEPELVSANVQDDEDASGGYEDAQIDDSVGKYEPFDVLRRLPGVNDRNIPRIINAALAAREQHLGYRSNISLSFTAPQTLHELALLNAAQLGELLNNTADGEMLYKFLHHVPNVKQAQPGRPKGANPKAKSTKPKTSNKNTKSSGQRGTKKKK